MTTSLQTSQINHGTVPIVGLTLEVIL